LTTKILYTDLFLPCGILVQPIIITLINFLTTDHTAMSSSLCNCLYSALSLISRIAGIGCIVSVFIQVTTLQHAVYGSGTYSEKLRFDSALK